MPGLVPGIHDDSQRAGAVAFSALRGRMDCRDKPGNDGPGSRPGNDNGEGDRA
jgi:hypothetical protein